MTFEDILNTPVTDIKPTPPYPAGTYAATLVKVQDIRGVRTANRETGMEEEVPVVTLEFRPVEVLDPAISPEAVKEAGGLGANARVLRKDYWLRGDGLNQLKMAAIALGAVEKKGKVLADMLAEANGGRCKLNVAHRAATDGSGNIYNEVKGVFAL